MVPIQSLRECRDQPHGLGGGDPVPGRCLPRVYRRPVARGALHRFATYTGAKIDLLDIQPKQVHWRIVDRNRILEMVVKKAASAPILGPTRVDMGIRVNETLQAIVEARLTTKTGEVLFEGTGRNAGLEVQGDLERLR